MRSILFATLACTLSIHLAGQATVRKGRVEERHDAWQARGIRYQVVSLFDRVMDPSTDALWRRECAKAEVFRLDAAKASALVEGAPAFIALQLPSAEGSMVLELEHTRITTDDLRVTLASQQPVELPPGLHYRGVIRGVPGSLVAVSVFPDEVMAIVSDASGERVLGRFAEDRSSLHVFYHERDLLATSGLTCHAVDEDAPHDGPQHRSSGGAKTVRCVRYYWEVNYDIYQNKGSVVNTVNYVTGLFNQSAILFDNDGIDVTLSEVFVWDVASPYTQTSTSALLNQFGITRTSFNGDMAHLLGYAGGGGIAWLNTLCNGQTRYRMAYSDINSTFSNVPTYSWSVEVVTHEQGHNLGSKHTHACAWNGNNTAIDGCGPTANSSYAEGTCATGPLPAPGMGTIMSYCHLVGGVGIGFVNGFGPQPTTVIVNAVNGASCLSTCGATCDAPGNLTAYSITSSTATLSWSSVGATGYTLQWKPASSGTWNTVTGLTGNTYALSGLSQSTTYDFRVMSICGTSNSVYSGIQSFNTPAACPDSNEPNNSLGAAAAITLPASINALIASSSDVDYYTFTTTGTGTINVFLGNVAGDYDVRLLNSGGTQLAISQNGGTSSESITYASAPAGTYYVHAYGWNGAFSASACYLLTVSLSGVQTCATPSGVEVMNVTYNSAFVTWSTVSGASAYDLRYKPSAGSTWTNVNGLTGSSHTLTPLTPTTQYDLQLRAVCQPGGQGSSTSAYTTTLNFTTLEPPCDVAPPIRVVLKVILDGAYRLSDQLMVDSLRVKGLLPLQEPYTALGYTLDESASTMPSVFAVSGAQAIVDWVLVELRDAVDPTIVVESRAGLLQRDGDVVAMDGVSPLPFCSTAGDYRVAVRHRNHLACMTASNLALNATPTEIDLTSAATVTYGIGARKATGGIRALWSGNATANGMVSYTGNLNDRDPILAAIGGLIPTNTVTGYLLEDITLDGLVRYTGDGNDRDVILGNIGGTVPTNVVLQQLP